jgi:hypothetical protein
VLPLVPWFAAAVLAGGFTIWFERHVIGAQGDAFGLSSVERVLLAGRVILFYLGKLFWPVNLVFIYPRWSIDGSVWWQYLYPAVAAAIALVLASLRCRGALAGYLFFCGTLVPVLGFVNVYPFLFPMSPITSSIWQLSASSRPWRPRWPLRRRGSGRHIPACPRLRSQLSSLRSP